MSFSLRKFDAGSFDSNLLATFEKHSIKQQNVLRLGTYGCTETLARISRDKV